MDELELEAQGKKIKFTIHDSSWCEVYLLVNGEFIPMGGERWDKIISNLLISFITQGDRKYFTYQDMELFTVFNLMGPHAVEAGKESNNYGVELLFLSNEGNVIPMVTLSVEDIKEWIIKLVRFMTSYMHHN